ncbi:MAG: zinc ribbon domain-containing protein [Armatimonadetes bacterium]|nr:zinc ribbon domain-containing protein [Armatimonadota bacterium]
MAYIPCPQCGSLNRQGDAQCFQCSAPLAAAAPPPAPSAPPTIGSRPTIGGARPTISSAKPAARPPDPGPQAAPPQAAARPASRLPVQPPVPGAPRIADDLPPGAPRVADAFPPGAPRIADDLPPGAPRIASDLPPGAPRIDDGLPPGAPRISHDFPPGAPVPPPDLPSGVPGVAPLNLPGRQQLEYVNPFELKEEAENWRYKAVPKELRESNAAQGLRTGLIAGPLLGAVMAAIHVFTAWKILPYSLIKDIPADPKVVPWLVAVGGDLIYGLLLGMLLGAQNILVLRTDCARVGFFSGLVAALAGFFMWKMKYFDLAVLLVHGALLGLLIASVEVALFRRSGREKA